MEQAAGFEYEIHGDGEPVLFIHGAIVSDTFTPLIREHALSAFRCVRYRRRGYGASAPITAQPTIDQHAHDALTLMDALGQHRFHVVAHSGGGPIAVQMAVSAPEVVGTLVLLEPAVQNAEMARAFDEYLAPLVELYDSGERAKAVHIFMRSATSRDWRQITEERVPGAAEQAEIDAAATFHEDLPALRRWDFDTVGDLISQPSLLIAGEISERRARPAISLFRDAVRNSEYAVIDGADHSLATTRPEAVAPVVADFLERHPLT